MCKIGRNFKIQRPKYKYWIVNSGSKMMIDEFMESIVCNWKIKVQDHTKKGLKMSIRWKGDQNTHTPNNCYYGAYAPHNRMRQQGSSLTNSKAVDGFHLHIYKGTIWLHGKKKKKRPNVATFLFQSKLFWNSIWTRSWPKSDSINTKEGEQQRDHIITKRRGPTQDSKVINTWNWKFKD